MGFCFVAPVVDLSCGHTHKTITHSNTWCTFFHVLGESGLVYKAYIKTAVGKELVAVKTGKGT